MFAPKDGWLRTRDPGHSIDHFLGTKDWKVFFLKEISLIANVSMEIASESPCFSVNAEINFSDDNGIWWLSLGDLYDGLRKFLASRLGRFRFFEEAFLLADTSKEVVLGMPFLSLSDADIRFAEKDLELEELHNAEAMPIRRHQED